MAAQQDQAKEEARLALYKAITQTAEAINEEASSPTAAEALKHLAEAFAYTTSTAQPHG
ncbi:hypothetical protein PV569_13030 [Streptomyces scabiei]|uniref:hypothetical protein n=1 Tax=Streptomyces scabiei TaxID=1930 RepID=UPI0029A4A0F2|nr:hypothetical protein [Streptomyces scabiei]MDX3294630.1 hypothetical protein [Streptomyces scabiei]